MQKAPRGAMRVRKARTAGKDECGCPLSMAERWRCYQEAYARWEAGPKKSGFAVEGTPSGYTYSFDVPPPKQPPHDPFEPLRTEATCLRTPSQPPLALVEEASCRSRVAVSASLYPLSRRWRGGRGHLRCLSRPSTITSSGDCR